MSDIGDLKYLTPETEQRTLRLSEAIRKGKPIVGKENQWSHRLCALGCAWAGINGSVLDLEVLPCKKEIRYEMADRLGFSYELFDRVNSLHITGIPALAIADILESEGH